jgi:hypothetical protein
MPPDFEHPLLWGPADLWRPIAFTAQQQQNRQGNYLAEFALLKHGISPAQAEQTMVALVREPCFWAISIVVTHKRHQSSLFAT